MKNPFKTTRKPKFELGAFVKHRATGKHDAKKLLITGRGAIESASGEDVMYAVSLVKGNYAPRDDVFVRAWLMEEEIEAFTEI